MKWKRESLSNDVTEVGVWGIYGDWVWVDLNLYGFGEILNNLIPKIKKKKKKKKKKKSEKHRKKTIIGRSFCDLRM